MKIRLHFTDFYDIFHVSVAGSRQIYELLLLMCVTDTFIRSSAWYVFPEEVKLGGRRN